MGASAHLIRRLEPGDETLLEAFLLPRICSSFLLAANCANAGLRYTGLPLEGVYAGAFANGELCGVAAHYWTGNIVLQAPSAADALAMAAVEYSGRAVNGLLGPWAQVNAARVALGMHAQPTRHDSEEVLYDLELEQLKMPERLADGSFFCRRGEPADLETLLALSVLEHEELFDEAESPALRARLREWLERATSRQDVFLLEEGPIPVAISLFHGRAHGRVQVGGVYVLPEYRNRGCARSIVAGSLLLAQEGGIHRAVLFTGVDNVAAQRAYENIGFRPVGDYGIVLFERTT